MKQQLNSRGFAIVSAIFILVVLGLLGAAIATISSTQQVGSAQDIQGVRAYQAARTGIEWGLYQQLRNASCTPSPGVSFTPTPSTLSGFTVTVICTRTPDPGGFSGPDVYRIRSTACTQPNAGVCPNTINPGSLYIERQLEVTF